MILVTALPIRPNPLIATFVAIRKSPFLDTVNAVFACLHCFPTNERATLFITSPLVKNLLPTINPIRYF
jgi:hypothetical protein